MRGEGYGLLVELVTEILMPWVCLNLICVICVLVE